jgi:hypothetical protein
MARKIVHWLALGILAFTGVVGIYNGINEWGDPTTVFQQSVLIGVLVYGVSGLLTVFGLLRRARWMMYAAVTWAIAVTYVPGAAVMAYAKEGSSHGSAVAASVGAALIAAFVLWAIQRSRRQSMADS